MPSPTYTTTQLAAVNEILGSVGQAPVTVLDTTNPEVAFAYNTLMDISREVQAEGWNFNKEYEYEVTPDTSGYINIPSNVISMDLSDIYDNSSYDTVIRNGRLYLSECAHFNFCGRSGKSESVFALPSKSVYPTGDGPDACDDFFSIGKYNVF